jgi:hypothetical protein
VLHLGHMKVCPICFKQFKLVKYASKKQIYCSLRCRSKDYYNKYYEHFKWKKERVCVVCKKEFLPKRINQLQCSSKCTKKKWKKAHWRQVLDYENARQRMIARLDWKERICPFCNKIFLPKLGNKNQQIYCSQKCKNKANYRKSILNGKKKINASLYRIRHRNEIRKHNEEYKAKIRFGGTSKTLNKRLVIKRDKGLCQMCKKPYQIIHHIKYSGKLEDLVCLCRSCHPKLHHKLITT